jgi:hypothetical protein
MAFRSSSSQACERGDTSRIAHGHRRKLNPLICQPKTKVFFSDGELELLLSTLAGLVESLQLDLPGP